MDDGRVKFVCRKPHSATADFLPQQKTFRVGRTSLEKDRVEIAERADPAYWRRRAIEKKREERERKNREAIASIKVIDTSKSYQGGKLEFLGAHGRFSGKEVVQLLRESGNWFTTSETASRVSCTESNLTGNMLDSSPEDIVRVNQGERHFYLFSRGFIEAYQRGNGSYPRGDVRVLAEGLSVGYAKVRNLAQNLDFGVLEGRRRVLSKTEILMIKDIVDREKKLLSKMLSEVDSRRKYTFSELEIMGIPIAHFDREFRSGRLEEVKKRGVRAVRGSQVKEYLAQDYPSGSLSQGLRLLTYFNPHLHTTTEVIQETELTRTSVLHRLWTLLEENPNSCFRIRKSPNRSRIIATDEVMPFLRNWENRVGLQLVNAIRNYQLLRDAPSRQEARLALEDIKDLVSLDTLVSPRYEATAFRAFKTLRDFQGKKDFKGFDFRKGDLSMLYNYMRAHGYSTLDFKPELGLEDLKTMMGDQLFLGKVVSGRKKLGFALYRTYRPILDEILQGIGIVSLLSIKVAFDSFTQAIEDFDVDSGKRFRDYAEGIVKTRIHSIEGIVKARASSIEARPLSEGMVAEIDEGLNERIENALKVLPRKTEVFLRKRFGIGRERMSREQLSRQLKKRYIEIVNLEREALLELSKSSGISSLTDYLY